MVLRCSVALPCLRYLRAFCTVTAAGAAVDEHDPGRNTREHLQKQILQAGLQFLRSDVEKLRHNVARRGATADVDKLVSYCKTYNLLLKEFWEYSILKFPPRPHIN